MQFLRWRFGHKRLQLLKFMAYQRYNDIPTSDQVAVGCVIASQKWQWISWLNVVTSGRYQCITIRAELSYIIASPKERLSCYGLLFVRY